MVSMQCITKLHGFISKHLDQPPPKKKVCVKNEKQSNHNNSYQQCIYLYIHCIKHARGSMSYENLSCRGSGSALTETFRPTQMVHVSPTYPVGRPVLLVAYDKSGNNDNIFKLTACAYILHSEAYNCV